LGRLDERCFPPVARHLSACTPVPYSRFSAHASHLPAANRIKAPSLAIPPPLPTGWDTPLSSASPLLSPSRTLTTWVPEILLHVVHATHWHMLARAQANSGEIYQSCYAAIGGANACLR
jgi:hypothetical protein